MVKRTDSSEKRLLHRVTLRRAITFEVGAFPKGDWFISGKPLRGFLVNISNGGICFKTKHRIQKEMVLKVRLPVSEISPAAPTLAQVLWVRRDPKLKEYRTGMRFII